jgi:hypothetical protein
MLVVVAGASLTVGCSSPMPPTEAAPTPVPLTLWDAYAVAAVAVRERATDAALLSASTQWKGPSEDDMLAGGTHWAFVFHSRARGSNLDVMVRGDAAQVAKETRVWVAPAPLGPGSWEQGPREALLVFLGIGGRTFLTEHADGAVDLHLGLTDDGLQAWEISAISPATGDLFSALIESGSNRVLRE